MKSCQFLLTPVPNVTYSACLVDKIEEMFETGRAPYPVERTLIVSGMLESCLTSKLAGKQASGNAAPQRALSGAEDDPARGGVTTPFQIA